MIKIQQTTEQIKFAKEYLDQGGVANRGRFDGDNTKQFFGMLGQIIVCDHLRLPRPENKGRFDGGYDIWWKGLKYDVKTRIGTTKFNTKQFSHNLPQTQSHYNVDGYVFVAYNQIDGYFELCGHISKHDFMKHATLHCKGDKRMRTDGTEMTIHETMYEIKQEHLEEF